MGLLEGYNAFMNVSGSVEGTPMNQEDTHYAIRFFGPVGNVAIPVQAVRVQMTELGRGMFGVKAPEALPRLVELSNTQRCRIQGIYAACYGLKTADNMRLDCLPLAVDVHGPDAREIYPAVYMIDAGTYPRSQWIELRLDTERGRVTVAFLEAEKQSAYQESGTL